jgi:hypothetical protein
MLGHYELLHAIAHLVVVPDELAQELLQSSRSHARGQSDRLHAFLWEIRELPANVGCQMLTSITPCKALGKMFQEIVQFWLQEPNLLSIHAMSSITSAGEHSLVNLADPGKAKLAL